MSICVHQPLVWYMTNKHAAGYVGLFKGPEMEALERRGSFSCPGVTLCQPRRQRSLAWVRSVLSNVMACTCASKCTHLQGHLECMGTLADAHVCYFAATLWWSMMCEALHSLVCTLQKTFLCKTIIFIQRLYVQVISIISFEHPALTASDRT